jgi:hypothetical protein
MEKQMYYHFLSFENAVKDLENKRVKVSTLDSLNDPFEFMPYRRYKFKERQPYNKVFNAVSKKWGILCFSQVWNEQLLWAHYAEAHKGIALGFEIPEDKMIKVSYVTEEIRKQFELTDSQEENERKFLDLAETKFQEWSYEKEYRLLLQLGECIQENGLYFISFSDNMRLTEIVLGCRFDHDKDRERISELAKRLGVNIIPTRPGWEDYRIHQCGTKTELYQNMTKCS